MILWSFFRTERILSCPSACKLTLIRLKHSWPTLLWVGHSAYSSSHHNDVSPTDSKGREINTSKMVFRWAAVRQARRLRQHPRPALSCRPAPSHEPRGPPLDLLRLSPRCSYTNRSSFQKTTSTMERGAGMDLLSWGIWGPQNVLDFSYKAKHLSLSTPNVAALLSECVFLFVCVCVAHFLMTITLASRIW